MVDFTIFRRKVGSTSCLFYKSRSQSKSTLEELLLAVVLFSGFLTLADFNLAVFHPEGISAVLSLALQIQPLMLQGCPRAVTKDSQRKPLKMKGKNFIIK